MVRERRMVSGKAEWSRDNSEAQLTIFTAAGKSDQNTTREHKAFRVFHFSARFTIIICPPAGFFKFLMIHSKKIIQFSMENKRISALRFQF